MAGAVGWPRVPNFLARVAGRIQDINKCLLGQHVHLSRAMSLVWVYACISRKSVHLKIGNSPCSQVSTFPFLENNSIFCSVWGKSIGTNGTESRCQSTYYKVKGLIISFFGLPHVPFYSRFHESWRRFRKFSLATQFSPIDNVDLSRRLSWLEASFNH